MDNTYAPSHRHHRTIAAPSPHHHRTTAKHYGGCAGGEGGSGGGKVIAEGTPEQVAKKKGSYTGQYVKKALA